MVRRIPHPDLIGVVMNGSSFKTATSVSGFAAILERIPRLDYLHTVSGSAASGAPISEGKTIEDFRIISRVSVETWRKIGEDGPETVFDFRFANELKKLFDDSFWKSPLRNAKRAMSMWAEIRRVFSARSLLPADPHPLLRIMRGYKPELSVVSPLEFEFSVFNNDTGRTEIISSHEDRFRNNPEMLREFVIASTSLEPFLPPRIIEGVPYSDGLCVDIWRAMDRCGTVFVLVPYPEHYRPPHIGEELRKKYHMPPWLADFIFKHSVILMERDADRLRAARALASHRNIRLHVIHYDFPSTLTSLSFRKGDIAKAQEMAAQKTGEFLDEIGF